MKDIPKLGLGFWQIEESDAKRVFIEGYEIGYRHFDHHRHRHTRW